MQGFEDVYKYFTGFLDLLFGILGVFLWYRNDETIESRERISYIGYGEIVLSL